ncbi:4-hydroxybutyrate CoA-transferase [Flavipsychrobacter stenotrophus]|uniref:4-hydroxybutyrate CoA-transferase n=1 Tax=Flavipsychrobacter stenotrophus TaxID=2077091 RepID=A0A2S7SSB0_9BACT|nr:acetyl-CoA hydrolase/transferase C-terminal domain-containing protein [Flavipsychrobacter stenotrophus]PQJ09634.1 4-hydroxybutyrate CoA-transferase [Flavipsychrobacter stenotrophus]
MRTGYIRAEDAVKIVESGSRVFIHGSAATPVKLIEALLARAGELSNIELTAITTYGAIDWNHPEIMKTFYLNSLFVSDNTRGWVNSDHGGYIPVFLSEIPKLFNEGYLPIDVAMLQVSPPDAHGYCTLGTSADVAISAARNAKKIIAQVNPRMPRVLGDGFIHISRFDAMVWEDVALPEVNYRSKADPVAELIGRQVAAIIEDGSTLQMGIGTIPNAILGYLGDHKNLGVHTEMFSDGVVSLVEKGAITNSLKKVARGKIISSFVLGTQRVYDFVDNNPYVNCMDVAYVNDVSIIRKNPKVVAINSAIEIDLTGQVCADSVGTYQYSGIGGQMDFMRGAALSEGGKPIIAIPSVTSKGISRIVPHLNEGAGVVTTRGHIHYVATEYGIVNLYGKNLEQRARLLISIAHPAHKESLERAYHQRFGRMLTNL